MTSQVYKEIADAILERRLHHPELVRTLAKNRLRRINWQADRLVIVAADHVARGVTAAGGDAWIMANRVDMLVRIARVLQQPDIDGVLATPDVMDELFLLNHWVREQGGPDFLDRKILVGSMNRSGLANAAFELDDFVTGYTANALTSMNLDAGKLLFRLNLESLDSVKTLHYCVDALNDLIAQELPHFLEPLAVPHSTDALVRLVGVAAALGESSYGRWLKLPMADDFERVAQATLCPILLLGGGRPSQLDEFIENVKRCMDAGSNVRGLMVGRNALYPPTGDDPVDVSLRLAAAVHQRSMREGIKWPKLMSTH